MCEASADESSKEGFADIDLAEKVVHIKVRSWTLPISKNGNMEVTS